MQRADGASVSVDDKVLGEFKGPGVVALVGVTHSDTETQAKKLAEKIVGLRIFPGPDGREASASDLNLPILVISQFTLYGQTTKGRRPTWEAAAPGHVAEPLVEVLKDHLIALGSSVETGEFGADMRVNLTNDGPVTLILDVE